MRLLDELLVEPKMIELTIELDRDEVCARAEALYQDERRGLRARLGGWLVRAGLWLDPRADERLSRSHGPRKVVQRA